MFRKHRSPVGAQPGHFSERSGGLEPKINVIAFNQDSCLEHAEVEVSALSALRAQSDVIWVDVQGLGNSEILSQIGALFDIHPLALADIVNIPQRPKVEDYSDNLFVIAIMATLKAAPVVELEQMSLFFGDRFVLTFQEKYGDVLEPVRARLRQGKGLIRKQGGDYLAYAILDTVIDAYYPVIEAMGEYFEDLEDQVASNPSEAQLPEIFRARREILNLRRAIYPHRELVNGLIRDESELLSDTVRMYLRDCYDHCAQLIDVVETYREICSGLMDLYLSSVSNRMNEVMKVLTIIATIFIPLSFFAGVYGMNFEYIPELKYRLGYPLFWLAMLAIAAGMLGYFRHIGWLEGKGSKKDS